MQARDLGGSSGLRHASKSIPCEGKIGQEIAREIVVEPSEMHGCAPSLGGATR
jgi:hypothetical protein